MFLGQHFKPDCLPDTGNRGIPDSSWFEALFAFLMQSMLGIVLNRYNQLVFASTYCGGNIETKGQVAAPVITNLLPVDPNLALKIHRPEMQPDDFTRRGIHLKNASIP